MTGVTPIKSKQTAAFGEDRRISRTKCRPTAARGEKEVLSLPKAGHMLGIAKTRAIRRVKREPFFFLESWSKMLKDTEKTCTWSQSQLSGGEERSWLKMRNKMLSFEASNKERFEDR